MRGGPNSTDDSGDSDDDAHRNFAKCIDEYVRCYYLDQLNQLQKYQQHHHSINY